jgi:hypothetical protein
MDLDAAPAEARQRQLPHRNGCKVHARGCMASFDFPSTPRRLSTFIFFNYNHSNVIRRYNLPPGARARHHFRIVLIFTATHRDFSSRINYLVIN